MTTYALLELGDDGQVRAYVRVTHWPFYSDPVRPKESGSDRGQFSTFEIGRFSIDVAVMPERKERG